MLAIGAKLLLLATVAPTGFAACYRPAPAADPTARACEHSYENLFFRGGVTRFDDTISFDAANWNLSFFNSLRFNYYWEKGALDRARLPFIANWRGDIDLAAPTTITLSYVGEGELRIDGVPATPLPPSYRTRETITLTVPGGRRAFVLDYRFDDGSRVGDGRGVFMRGPYGGVQVRAGAALLRANEPPLASRVIGGFVDLVLLVVLGSIVWCYGQLLRRDVALAAVACVGGALLAIDPTVTMTVFPFLGTFRGEPVYGIPGGIGLTLVTATLFVLIARRPSTRLLLLAYLAIGWASAFRKDFFLRGFHSVLYRFSGDDWLTYESFGRAILETGSLEAGEPIFYYQPGFRYLVFLMHAMFGDGDTLTALFAQAVLIWSVFWMSARLLPRGMMRGSWRVLGLTVGLLLVMLVTSEAISRLIYFGASEYPSWIAFFMLFPRLAVSASRRDSWLGAMLLGLTLITRMNQAIALGWLFAVFLWRTVRARPRLAVQAVLLVAAIVSLPAAHNAYYGGELSILPREHSMTDTLPMPPSRWLRVFDDSQAREQALMHLAAVTYTTRLPIGSAFVPTDVSHLVMLVACRGLQAAWVLAAVLLFRTKTRATPRLLLIVPALFLGPHLFYQVRAYHPRFIIIGYLAMGAVAMLAIRERAAIQRTTAS